MGTTVVDSNGGSSQSKLLTMEAVMRMVLNL